MEIKTFFTYLSSCARAGMANKKNEFAHTLISKYTHVYSTSVVDELNIVYYRADAQYTHIYYLFKSLIDIKYTCSTLYQKKKTRKKSRNSESKDCQ